MCMICDNPEGNMCQRCESDMEEVKQASLYDADGWWPMIATGQRSINVACGSTELPADFMYV